MIRSMTGYARAEAVESWGRISWELRSVNHRYLDLQIKMPDELRALETELRAQASSRISRGKVECGLRYTRDAGGAEPLQLDLLRLQQIKLAIAQVAGELGATSPPDILRVLAYPGVVRQEQADFAPMLRAAKSLFEAALKDFTDTRSREGARLALYLQERTEALTELVAQVRARYAVIRVQWLDRLRGKIRELGVEIDPGRLEQEMVMSLQRLDIEEEMSRLLSHLIEVRDTLRRDEAIGRRLDFLMQELNREANTLSSKSQDAEMTRCAVEMKVMIEQMREQVQNIE